MLAALKTEALAKTFKNVVVAFIYLQSRKMIIEFRKLVS